jgi:hypothetical protein
MTLAADILSAGLRTWMLALAAVIAFRLLTGQINNHGLFRSTNRARGGGLDPERLQAGVAIPIVLGGYALEVLQTGAVTTESGQLALPDVPRPARRSRGKQQSLSRRQGYAAFVERKAR